ncbi:hypothetical protein NDU88_008424 [Pleurodeles waltl]|uniref:Uncharacterized protein n=1 Tax=Pleurodeles waltl TaxID=8319 RepID=A0AAV7QRQ2_PLEWA|nr:hypothetical protein NDU88_008424 [Pleurodeles waltl]
MAVCATVRQCVMRTLTLVQYGIRCRLEEELIPEEAKLSALENLLSSEPQNIPWQLARRDLLDDWCRLAKHDYTAYRQQLHEEGDATGAMLAWLLKQQTVRMPVLASMDGTGRRVCTQEVSMMCSGPISADCMPVIPSL